MLGTKIRMFENPHSLLDGSVSIPSLFFAADPNTGLYRIGDDRLGIAAGGTLIVTISNSAITLAKNIDIAGSGLLTTSHRIDEDDATWLAFRNRADSAYTSVKAMKFAAVGSTVYTSVGFELDAAAGYFNAKDADNGYTVFKARKAGDALYEVARLAGAADPYWCMGGGQQHKFTYAGNMGLFGVSPVSQAGTYTPTNITEDRAFDCDTVLVAELADVVATLITELRRYGLVR